MCVFIIYAHSLESMPTTLDSSFHLLKNGLLPFRLHLLRREVLITLVGILTRRQVVMLKIVPWIRSNNRTSLATSRVSIIAACPWLVLIQFNELFWYVSELASFKRLLRYARRWLLNAEHLVRRQWQIQNFTLMRCSFHWPSAERRGIKFLVLTARPLRSHAANPRLIDRFTGVVLFLRLLLLDFLLVFQKIT